VKAELSHPHASALTARQQRTGGRAWARWAKGGGGLFGLIKSAALGWVKHGATELAAAISYYAAFSLAPLLVIAVAVAGLVLGADKVKHEVIGQFVAMMGKQGGELVGTVLENASKPKEGALATILGIAALLVGASGAFGQLKEALNRTWEVREKKGGSVLRFLRTRFISFAMVLVIGFLLLVSLAVSALLTGVGSWVGGALPGWAPVLEIANFVVSIVVVTMLIALIYRFLPDAQIEWRVVWVGAAVTALLFTLGKFLIGLYLGRTSAVSIYGAAGSLAVILLWIYYTSLIFLFGAEITRAHAQRLGKTAAPKRGAERAETEGPGSKEREAVNHGPESPGSLTAEGSGICGRPARSAFWAVSAAGNCVRGMVTSRPPAVATTIGIAWLL
jgi:membrane protein